MVSISKRSNVTLDIEPKDRDVYLRQGSELFNIKTIYIDDITVPKVIFISRGDRRFTFDFRKEVSSVYTFSNDLWSIIKRNVPDFWKILPVSVKNTYQTIRAGDKFIVSVDISDDPRGYDSENYLEEIVYVDAISGDYVEVLGHLFKFKASEFNRAEELGEIFPWLPSGIEMVFNRNKHIVYITIERYRDNFDLRPAPDNGVGLLDLITRSDYGLGTSTEEKELVFKILYTLGVEALQRNLETINWATE